MMSNPQTQMPKSTARLEVMVGRPANRLQILLERLNQSIESRIEDGALVEVDDAMAAAFEIAEPEATIRFPMQGD